MLVAAWDQCAGLRAASPGLSIIEETALDCLIQLFEFDGDEVTGGFTTGTTTAHITTLLAARAGLLAERGWNVAANGLWGAPRFKILISADAHVSLIKSLQYIGLGTNSLCRVPTDRQGRMLLPALKAELADSDGPALVCISAGEIHTGGFDRCDDIADLTKAGRHWLHVDGAFGIWARASPRFTHLTRGLEHADSWAFDGHKLLVPFDCGVGMTRRGRQLREAMSSQAPYTIGDSRIGEQRDAMDHVLEMSRRARGVSMWAALRALGRTGVAEIVERCHILATRLAGHMADDPLVRVANDVELNQVLLDVAPPDLPTTEARVFVQTVIDAVRDEGACWIGGTTWRDQPMIRFSVANYLTTAEDIDVVAESIVRTVTAVTADGPPDTTVPARLRKPACA